MKTITLFFMSALLITAANAQDSTFSEMIKYAIKAPSGHNTQPWKFKIEKDAVEIIPDFQEELPIVDATHRELFISLGCAVENLCIAATHFGYQYEVQRTEAHSVIVRLLKTGEKEDPLFPQIEKRQTNRSIYQGRKLTADTLQMIIPATHSANINAQFFEIGTSIADTLANYIARGNEKQMSNDAFKTELLDWIRINKQQVDKTGNGLTYKTLGFPSIPGFIGKSVVRKNLQPEKQNKADLAKVNSSSHLVLFTITHNTIDEWIDLGRTLERFLLQTTALGIANAYMNQPCEEKELADEMQQQLFAGSKYPALLLRIGYAVPQPYSPRKEVKTFISATAQ